MELIIKLSNKAKIKSKKVQHYEVGKYLIFNFLRLILPVNFMKQNNNRTSSGDEFISSKSSEKPIENNLALRLLIPQTIII